MMEPQLQFLEMKIIMTVVIYIKLTRSSLTVSERRVDAILLPIFLYSDLTHKLMQEAEPVPSARIAVNGNAIGAFRATGYIRYASDHEESSLHLNEIIQLNANDSVTIITYRRANSGEVQFNGSGTSSFMINKLK